MLTRRTLEVAISALQEVKRDRDATYRADPHNVQAAKNFLAADQAERELSLLWNEQS